MRLHLNHHHIGRVLAAIGVAMIGLAMMGPVSAAPAGSTDPAGNNGTIKIDGVPFDTHPDNQPHVSCTFQVDFYGYEAKVPATMEFSVQPPTGNEVIRTVNGVLDGDDASGANMGGIDGQFTIDLTGPLAAFTPHPNQGYHVKLTITADDGTPPSNDTKSKVFWVGPCENPTTTTGSTTTTTGSTTTTLASNTGPSVSGVVINRTPQQGAEVLGNQLARTGFSGVFLMAGIMLVSIGLVFEGVAQMARRRSTIS